LIIIEARTQSGVGVSETVFVRDIKFEAFEDETRRLLADLDAGKFDEELGHAGIGRDPSTPLSSAFEVSQSQYMSPEQWTEISVVFGSVVAPMARDVWKSILLPKLKRAFHEDRVSSRDPKAARGPKA